MADRGSPRRGGRLRDRLPDDRVIRVERARWGFATPTRLLTLASARRVVIQRVTGTAAGHAPEGARVLREAGLPVPGLVARLERPGAVTLVWEFVDGSIGASLMDGDQAATLARQMGEVQRAIGAIRASAVPADESWSGPGELRRAVRRWLAGLRWAHPASEPALVSAMAAIVDRVADRPWTTVVTHGDYVPANVLVADGGISAIMDLGDVALRHPLVDGAWWSLIVAYHHGSVHRQLETAYLAGAGLPATSKTRGRLADVAAVRALQLAAASGGGTTQRGLLAAAIARAARAVGAERPSATPSSPRE